MAIASLMILLLLLGDHVLTLNMLHFINKLNALWSQQDAEVKRHFAVIAANSVDPRQSGFTQLVKD